MLRLYTVSMQTRRRIFNSSIKMAEPFSSGTSSFTAVGPSSDMRSHPQKVCQKCGEIYHIATKQCKICGESIVLNRQYKVPTTLKPKRVCREKFNLQQKAMNLHYSNGYEVVVLYAKKHRNGALGISTFGTPGVMPFIGKGRFAERPEGGRLCCQLFERFFRDSQMKESQQKVSRTSSDAEVVSRTSSDAEVVSRTSSDAEVVLGANGDAEVVLGANGDAEVEVNRSAAVIPVVKHAKRRKTTKSKASKKNKLWRVEKVLKIMKGADGKLKFLIKWLDFDANSNSWEPEENLLPTLVQDALALLPIE